MVYDYSTGKHKPYLLYAFKSFGAYVAYKRKKEWRRHFRTIPKTLFMSLMTHDCLDLEKAEDTGYGIAYPLKVE